MRSLLVLFFLLFSITAHSTYKVQYYSSNKNVKVISVRKVNLIIKKRFQVLRDIPVDLEEGSSKERTRFKEVLYQDQFLPPLFARSQSLHAFNGPNLTWPNSEVRTLVDQGPDSNRITLTILGDGYTLEQKERFFSDAKRLTQDLFKGQTFASYLPLFNVHAVFTPSAESGITDLVQKRTAFSLYRSPRGSKRGILPGNRSALEKALGLAPAPADYPIVIANDEYYGGLGGRYAITTRSLTSGSMVLRHELGHNFGNVGEEYDGGGVYQGANFSSSKNLPWRHWESGDREIHQALNLGGEYLWKSITREDYSYDFDFPSDSLRMSARYRIGITLSSVGWSHPNEVSILLDGVEVPYKGVFTKDRSFFEVLVEKSVEAGRHTLTIRDNHRDNDNVLAYFRVYAYPMNYNFSENKIAGFANYNESSRLVGYRPTHKMCLMRDMRSVNFCPIDKENMWQRFLNTVSLIDEVEVTSINNERKVILKSPKLQGLAISWFKREGNQWNEITKLRGQQTWVAGERNSGSFKVEVLYKTPEVRKYTDRFRAQAEFSL